MQRIWNSTFRQLSGEPQRILCTRNNNFDLSYAHRNLPFVEDISRGLNSVFSRIDISSSGLWIRVPKYFSDKRDVHATVSEKSAGSMSQIMEADVRETSLGTRCIK
ncbi:MAG TPA: hypothetical protein VLB46_20945 [Pyrinomonadaceae bacterium]|nr:hypothetical protein [Pyrinomonadaceae bacterium]